MSHLGIPHGMLHVKTFTKQVDGLGAIDIYIFRAPEVPAGDTRLLEMQIEAFEKLTSSLRETRDLLASLTSQQVNPGGTS